MVRFQSEGIGVAPQNFLDIVIRFDIFLRNSIFGRAASWTYINIADTDKDIGITFLPSIFCGAISTRKGWNRGTEILLHFVIVC